MRATLRGMVCCCLLLIGVGRADAAGAVRVGNVPRWVQRQSLPAPDAQQPSEHGIRMLLFDQQVRYGARGRERYTHNVRQIADEAGLQASSQISFSFDPSYETVEFHALAIVRDGQRRDALQLSAMKRVQREPNLEGQLYDGRQTLVLFVEDVRVGDLLDLEYTISGADPTLAGHVDETLVLALPMATARMSARIVLPPNRMVRVQQRGPGAEQIHARVTHNPAGDEYAWEREHLPAQPIDATVSWFYALPVAELSDFPSWAEVAAWGNGLLHTPAHPSAALVRQAQALQKGSIMDTVRATTRFVQDQVRYVGIEAGLSRRRATAPEVVLARRFGDCKDKSVLLASLLQIDGVPATPALVSTALREHLADAAPSASPFNHAIVRVGPLAGGESYWIDPTVALQGGDLSRAARSPFGRALVLAPATEALAAIPPEKPWESSAYLTDHYVVPEAGSDGLAQLEVTREFRGPLADTLRAQIRASSAAELAKTYLQLYAQQFPDVESTGPVELHDDREEDRLRVVVHFQVRHPWRWSEPRRRWEMTVQPTVLDDMLRKPQIAGRQSPLATPFGQAVHCVIELEMPQTWPVQPERRHAESPAFSLLFQSSGSDRLVRYDYLYETRSDHVAPAELAQHAAAIEQANGLLARQLSKRPTATGPNPWAWLAVLLALVLCAPLLPRIYRDDPPPADPDDRAVRPLNGWLAIVGLRTFGFPILCAWQLFKMRLLFTRSSWDALSVAGAQASQPVLASIIFAEIAAQTAVVCIGSLLAVLYVRQRTSFPRYFTRLTLFALGFGLVDELAVTFTNAAATHWRSYVIGAVFGLLFERYVRTSARARAAFNQSATRPRATVVP